LHCEEESVLFPNIHMTNNFCDTIKTNSSRPHFVPNDVLQSLKLYQTDNNYIIREADKNAGICVMNWDLYDKEVFNLLEDLNAYHPSTESQYLLHTLDFEDKLKI